MPKVSVIIPCFNLSRYLREAVDSVLSQTFPDFEIIIVNYGSTDPETLGILDSFDNPKIKVVATENRGLPAARNFGIAEATGEYILPVDADDRIAPTYLEKGVEILDRNKNAGIVYCLAEFFGEENFRWDLPDYELSRILIDNLIFVSAFFRREDWKTTGGYKPTMIYGWEDYEFWLSIIELGREVCRIPEYLFYYRKRSDSISHQMSKEHLAYSYREIAKNHPALYLDNIQHIFAYVNSLRETIAEKERHLLERESHIRGLNHEISRLEAQLTSGRVLARRLSKVVLRKLGLKTE